MPSDAASSSSGRYQSRSCTSTAGHAGGRAAVPRHRRGRVRRLRRPLGLRQDHRHAHGRRAGNAHHRRGAARRPPVTGPSREKGMVFQSYSSFPWLTVLGNIRFGMKYRRDFRQPKRTGSPATISSWSGSPVRRLPHQPHLGRHAPARGDRPHARRRPARPAHGRAVRRARRADPRAAAAAAPAAPGCRAQDGDLRHPRRRRGGVPRRPHRRLLRTAGACAEGRSVSAALPASARWT